MTSLIDLFKAKENDYKVNTKTDKTPLSVDGGTDLIANDELVNNTRGGKINTTPYSSTVKF